MNNATDVLAVLDDAAHALNHSRSAEATGEV